MQTFDPHAKVSAVTAGSRMSLRQMHLLQAPMGGTLVPGGATFRVFAPHANSVHVCGDFNNWVQDASCQLAPIGGGHWAVFIPALKDGDPYMYYIDGQGSSGYKRDPHARLLTIEPPFPHAHSVLRNPAAFPWHDVHFTPPPFNELVIYQLHVGSFDIKPGNPDGCFLDVIARVPHLASLGINAIELLPVQEFPTSFSMGYNGTDLFSPETEYGEADAAHLKAYVDRVNAILTAAGQAPYADVEVLRHCDDQLRALIDVCHVHGIGVIFDVVYNHAGGGFDEESIWFHDREPWGDNNRSLYFTDQGWAGGEIFAYWNDWVSQFLIDNARGFVSECHIDGIRYDEVRVIENNGGRTFCQRLTASVRATKPSCVQIAEYWNPDRPSAVRPPGDGLGFDAELGDGLRDALRGLLGQASAGASAPIRLADVAATLVPPAGFDAAWRIVQCLENQDLTYAGHDGAARVPALADGGDRRSWYARSRSRVVTALQLTAPGIPSLFMGQEILEDKLWSDSRDAATLVWWDGLTATADPAMRDFLRCVTDLIVLRRTRPALRANGARVSRANDFERVIVLHRWIEGSGQDVVMVASFDESPKHGYWIGLPYAGIWQEVWNSDYYDAFPNASAVGNGGSVQAWGGPLDGFAASAPVTLPANGVIVLARD